MTEDRDIPSPQEDAYAMYEALTDQCDAAELLAQEAEGQPVGDVWEERRRELDELRPLLTGGRQRVDAEPEDEDMARCRWCQTEMEPDEPTGDVCFDCTMASLPGGPLYHQHLAELDAANREAER